MGSTKNRRKWMGST